MNVDVGLTRSTINPMLASQFPVKGASKKRPHSSEPPAARTGQHQLTTFQAGLIYYPSITYARRFRCEDSNADLMCVQTHYGRVWQVEPGTVREQSSF